MVSTARGDQLSFAAEHQSKGIAFRGTVQKKGIKPSTASGFDFTGYDLGGGAGGVVAGSGQARRVNVNYGYVFLGEGTAEDKRALCLFEPDDLKAVAELQVGQSVTLTCLFSKFVGGDAQPTPVFWACSVLN
jgi:hypothetical protein